MDKLGREEDGSEDLERRERLRFRMGDKFRSPPSHLLIDNGVVSASSKERRHK